MHLRRSDRDREHHGARFDGIQRMKLNAHRQHVPLTPHFDHLLRYEASLERNFDRTLIQFERGRPMRLGQPVPVPISVNLSAS